MHSLIVAWLSRQASTRLGEVQRALEKQNGTASHPPIGAFLISNEERAALPGSNPHTPEQIFVSDDENDPRMGVFIDKQTLERMAAREPELGRAILLDIARILAERLRTATDFIADWVA
jgi:hypothetical protein